MTERVVVIGAGLAGAEAAWQLAKRGIPVRLYEMRPGKMTPAHHTGYFAELVCSNSLRSDRLENAVGLLKEEMRCLDSLIMACAEEARVPAGGALAVDREIFARLVTERLSSHPLVEVVREEVTSLPEKEITVLATGPLTSEAMSRHLQSITGEEYFYFYDAAAPIVTAASIDMDKAFRASRYGRGEDYINCPLTEEEYRRFWEALVTAETVPLKSFEKEIFFEGCMPVEVLAARGPDTLRFGPMKPVGLIDPRTGREPYAVVQLRQDNRDGTLYNMVGFQTRLKWGEQERVFRMIPALARAEFVRLGVVHRNTYINSPRLLLPTLQLKKYPHVFVAGQISGVEGYVESAAMGLVAGINASRRYRGLAEVVFPPETAMGSLIRYITTADPRNFQPMNVTYGLFPPLPRRVKDRRQRNELLAQRALDQLAHFVAEKEL